MKKNLLIFIVMMISMTCLWGQYSGEGVFEKVENLAGLESGGYYVFYGERSGNSGAMKNTISSGRLQNDSSISPTTDEITDPGAELVFKIEGNETSGHTIYNEAVSKYVEISTGGNTAKMHLEDSSSHTYEVSYYEDTGFFFKSNHADGGNRSMGLYTSDWRTYTLSDAKITHLYKLNTTATPQVVTPTFSPAGGEYYYSVDVAIECETVGATIYYTIDGSDPTISITRVSYISPLTLMVNTTVKAYATKTDYDDSAVAEATYTINPATGLTVDFFANPIVAFEDHEVIFSDMTTGGVPPYQYSWDFGDGETSTVENPIHTYTSAGTYTVSLTVTDANTDSDFETKTDYITVTAAPVIPTGMFISEYIEGSSNNKAIEIYNGTGADVDLAPYRVRLASNGNDWGNTLDMTGTLLAGEVFVIANASADALILAVSDVTSNVTYFNGDDAVGLFFGETLIDVIGVPNLNPYVKWEVAGVTDATDNHTLVRKNSVTEGTTDWAASAGTNADDSQWHVHPIDTFSYLGTHGEVVLPTVSTPEITPIAGQYVDQVEVSISCATVGATVYYTTNGVDPTATSTEYTATFFVTESATVKAFAVKADHTDSAIAQSAYVITDVLPDGVDPTIGTLFISEVSDVDPYTNEYIELYNNSDYSITLENITLRMDLTTNFPLNTVSYVGDRVIQPGNYLIITRGGTQTAFEETFGALPAGVGFLQGSSGMYFGTGTQRRWQIILDTGAKAELIIDDTLVPVGGTGNTSYQSSPGVWETEAMGNSTPGGPHLDQTLPVTLSSFMAVQTSENFAQITWTTESETGLLGYNVFRNELREEDTAYRVNANLIEAENNSVGSSYSYLDESVDLNTTYYYWLQINEFDGSVSFAGPYQIRIEPDNNSSDVVTPGSTTLNGIYPNPFNPTTAVSFYMGQEDNITLNVYNMKGQLITNLATEKFAEGFHNVVWNGKDANGRDCASGIYFFRMETKSDVQTIKGILMK